MRRGPLHRLASATALGVVAAGVPAALALLGGWPLPRRLLAVAEVRAALADGWTPDGRFVVGVLSLTLWALWAHLMAWVLAELRRARRNAARGLGPDRSRVRRRLRGAHWLAAVLVRGVLASGPVVAPVLAALPPARLPQVLLTSGVAGPGLVPAPVPAAEPARAPSEPQPTYVVQPWAESRDCLWVLAERYLGDPFRWSEIYELNRDRLQPDGRTLGGDPYRWVYPGWILQLPIDARGDGLVRENGSRPASVQPRSAAAAPAPAEPAAPPLDASSPVAATAAEPVAPTREAGEGQERAPKGRSESPVAATARSLLPPVIAGAVLAELARRSLVQHRRRRRGRQVSRPAPEARTVEWRLRAIPEVESAEWVDLSMRLLAVALAEAPEATQAAVVCVRAGALGVEVVVDPPTPDAPPGFVAQEDGRLWRLDPAISLESLRGQAAGAVALAPALLTVGTTEEGCVLVNLEAAGSLAVEGDPGRVRRFLAGAALELATAPWAAEVPLHLLGGDDNLAAGNTRVRLHDDLDSLSEIADITAAAVAASLNDTSTTLAARLADEGAEDWAPVAVVTTGGVPLADGLAELVARAEPHRSGVVCVVPGPVEGARWRLVVDGEGRAVLHPLGLEVDSHLDGDTVEGAGELLAARADTDDVAPVVELVHVEDQTGGVPGVAPRLRVRFLCRRPTVDWPGEPPSGGKAEELVLYLAANEGLVSRDRLRGALWPMNDADPFNERSLNTLRTAVSRARTAAGYDPDGEPIVAKSPAKGYYGLSRHGWTSDWREFQTLMRRAERASLSESMELLTQALELVEDGVPLSDVPPDAYSWALTDLQDIVICRIVDAAEALAEQALEAGDADLVEFAARKGLAVSPSRESLWRARMQAAADRHDPDALKRAFDGACRAAKALDPLAEPDVETVRLYRSLQRTVLSVPAGPTSDADASTPTARTSSG